jgi:hypothetical protein
LYKLLSVESFLLQSVPFHSLETCPSFHWVISVALLFSFLQGIDDESYECVYECQDSVGNRGVRLSKQIVKVSN